MVARVNLFNYGGALLGAVVLGLLSEVTGLGPRTFELAAGFLRISDAEHPLDSSAVHPERYALVERMAQDLNVPLASLIGSTELLRRIDRARYKTQDVGDFTLDDILKELDKPGRDPRKSFEPPKFRDDVRELGDLKPGMELEGVVTNITAFGAFVDVGVHQDGLVHISQLTDRFVKDPHEIVKVGDKLQVRVLEVDLERRRIALTARKGHAPKGSAGAGPKRDDRPPADRGGAARPSSGGKGQRDQRGREERAPAADKGFRNNPFADFFNKR